MGHLGTTDSLGFVFFKGYLYKDTRKAVVKLPLQPQPSPVFVMSPGWVSAWLSCPEGSGRGTYLVLSFERKSVFPSFCFLSLDLNLLFISVYVRAPPCQGFT